MKIYIGKIDGEKTYLSKHSWDCDWYWGFGKITTKSCFYHFESLIGNQYQVDKVFEETYIDQKNWYILRDLFIQAYALRKAAEVYQWGGGQTTQKEISKIIHNLDKAKEINKDLKIILNTIWYLLKKWETEKDSKK